MNSWDRQPGEKALWFGRFDKFYRPLGTERNLLKAYNALRVFEGKSGNASSVPCAWDDAFKRDDWAKRAEAWDADQRRKRMAETEQLRQEMFERHKNQARLMQGIATRRLSVVFNQKALKKMEPGDQEAFIQKRLTLPEARHLLREGVTMERAAMGIPEMEHLILILGMGDDDLIRQYGYIIADGEDASGGPDGSGDQEAWFEVVPPSKSSEGETPDGSTD